MFKDRKLVIATMHEKEKVMSPILELHLGVSCFVEMSIDTDLFGTFIGEIERKDGPIVALRNKCIEAMKISGCDLGVASEGSFGSHPDIFFARANDELVILIDSKNNLEIIERELNTDTNFDCSIINSLSELDDFAKSIGFPEHGLIMKKSENDLHFVVKGIKSWEGLYDAFYKFKKKHDSVFLETDMRAMFNPTRLKNIELATFKLVEKVKCLCPNCDFPGFGITSSKLGLPCNYCFSPTRSVLSYTYSCLNCSFSQEKLYPNKIKNEDPMYCDLCNP